MHRRLLLLLVIVFVSGCASDTPPPAPTPETPAPAQAETPAPAQAEAPATSPQSATFSGHPLSADTVYYLDGPQQSRPPDGTLKAGTKVMVIQDSGSYCRVRSEDGIVAFVAAGSIQSPDAARE